MNKEEKLGLIYNSLAEELNITNTMLKRAETAYNALGDYIKSNNTDWDVSVYPQGSFELGTVVKPINDDDQYDVDLVVLAKKPSFTATNLRLSIRNLLENHGRYEGKIENKKPCIRITYSDSSQFHMDIASARLYAGLNDDTIEISKFDGMKYDYEISNPLGYIKWFRSAMAYDRLLYEQKMIVAKAETKVDELNLPKIRTPLQKAIQILKRHRDIYFAERNSLDDKPSSIILTTLCALTYDNTLPYNSDKENVYTTIVNMLDKFPLYIQLNDNNEYSLPNPSNTDENFLKKWNDDKTQKRNFDSWIKQARLDIITNPYDFIESDIVKLNEQISLSFGNTIGASALKRYGERMGLMVKNSELKYNQDRGTLTTKTQDKDYRQHTYFGDIDDKNTAN